MKTSVNGRVSSAVMVMVMLVVRESLGWVSPDQLMKQDCWIHVAE